MWILYGQWFDCDSDGWGRQAPLAAPAIWDEGRSLRELFSLEVEEKVVAAGRAAGLRSLSALSALVLAALAAGDEKFIAGLQEAESGPVIGSLLVGVGGSPGPGLFRGVQLISYTEEYDWARRVVAVRSYMPGRWIGKQGCRIRPLRAMLKEVGWDIHILPL